MSSIKKFSKVMHAELGEAVVQSFNNPKKTVKILLSMNGLAHEVPKSSLRLIDEKKSDKLVLAPKYKMGNGEVIEPVLEGDKVCYASQAGDKEVTIEYFQELIDKNLITEVK